MHGFANGNDECRSLKSKRTARETRKHKLGRERRAAVARNAHKRKWERFGPQLPAFQQSRAWYLYVESESVAIHCTLRREMELGGKGKQESKERESRRRQSARRHMRRESGIRMKAANECDVKARQRARGRRERRESGSDGKRKRGEAKERATSLR
jgi:hypothetical protein